MSITEYIQNNQKLSEMDYITVYTTILALIADGQLKWEGHSIV